MARPLLWPRIGSDEVQNARMLLGIDQVDARTAQLARSCIHLVLDGKNLCEARAPGVHGERSQAHGIGSQAAVFAPVSAILAQAVLGSDQLLIKWAQTGERGQIVPLVA